MKLFTKLQARVNSMRNEDGATAVEYGLLVSLIAVVIIAAVTGIGLALADTFGDVETALTTP
jgi:pilus assembly protein Flp/PilA